jgi:hypothetical protein
MTVEHSRDQRTSCSANYGTSPSGQRRSVSVTVRRYNYSTFVGVWSTSGMCPNVDLTIQGTAQFSPLLLSDQKEQAGPGSQ